MADVSYDSFVTAGGILIALSFLIGYQVESGTLRLSQPSGWYGFWMVPALLVSLLIADRPNCTDDCRHVGFQHWGSFLDSLIGGLLAVL